MEAARLPMLHFEPLISPEPTEFTGALLSLISSKFQEDPGIYRKECKELDALRANACRASRDYSGCSLLKRYYCQLHFLINRFPFLNDGNIPDLMFTWEDVYAGESSTHSDMGFEKAAILYNIGALHSILGTLDNRLTSEGMKMSCTHFQCAAWSFQYLRDNFHSNYRQEWSSEILSYHEQLMLAQSQECILEKSMADNRKATITAKVAAQCAEFYQKALSNLEQSTAANTFGSSRVKQWKRHIELKVNFNKCVTYHFLSIQSEEQQRYGERLSYCQAALAKFAECQKLAQNMDEETKTSLQFVNDVIGGKHAAAKKENDFVYHEKVPSIESLPEIKGAVLVKGIGFDVSDKEISGPDIFANLIPIEAHEASSLYSEEKAQLLRQIGERIEHQDTILEQYLSSLQLEPETLLPDTSNLPDELVEKCAAISTKPDTVKQLTDAIQDLSNVAIDTEADMKKIENSLTEDKANEAEFQKRFGERRRPSVLDEVSGDLEKCRQAFSKASHSNAQLQKAMDLHVQNLRLLASPLEQLKATLPNPLAALDDNENSTVQRIKELFRKVQEMKMQRNSLHDQIRKQILADDITKKIVTRSTDDTSALFAEQLRKHDSLKDYIEQNLNAQSRILDALTEANAKFVPVRQKIEYMLQQRESVIDELIFSADVYTDLLDKQQKGMEFYEKLQNNVKKILEQTRSVCAAQQSDRDKIEEKFKPKAPPPSRPTASKPGEFLTPSENKSPIAGTNKGGPPRLKDYLPFMKDGASAASAIAAGSVEEHFDDFSDLDDIQLPDLERSSPPKLKDYLPFMNKGGSNLNRHSSSISSVGVAVPQGLENLPPEVLKYMPGASVGTQQAAVMHFSPTPIHPAQRMQTIDPQTAGLFNPPAVPRMIARPSNASYMTPSAQARFSSPLQPGVNPCMAGSQWQVPLPSQNVIVPSNPSSATIGQAGFYPFMHPHGFPISSTALPTTQNATLPPSVSYMPQTAQVGAAVLPQMAAASHSSGMPMNTLSSGQMNAPEFTSFRAPHPQTQLTVASTLMNNVPITSQIISPQNVTSSGIVVSGTACSSVAMASFPVYTGVTMKGLPTNSLAITTGFPPGSNTTIGSFAGNPGVSSHGAFPSSTSAAMEGITGVNVLSKAGSVDPINSQQPYCDMRPTVNTFQNSQTPLNCSSPTAVNQSSSTSVPSVIFPPSKDMKSTLPYSHVHTHGIAMNQQPPQSTNSYLLPMGPLPPTAQMNQGISLRPQTAQSPAVASVSVFPSPLRAPVPLQNVLPSANQQPQSGVESSTGIAYNSPPQSRYNAPHYIPQTILATDPQVQCFPPNASPASLLPNANCSTLQFHRPELAPGFNQAPQSPYDLSQPVPVTMPGASQRLLTGAVLPQTDLFGYQTSDNRIPLQPLNIHVGSITSVSPATSQNMDCSRVTKDANELEQSVAPQADAGGFNSPAYSRGPTGCTTIVVNTPQRPVQTVQPVPKASYTYLADLDGVGIIPSSVDSLESKIDWSKATPNTSGSTLSVGNHGKWDFSNRPAPAVTPPTIHRQSSRDSREPYSDEASLEQFITSVEKFQKTVASLTKPSLSGPSPLDKEWKEINEEQERDSRRNSMAAGRSEPTRNRFQDIIPYDKYRVVLTGQKNDYINASWIDNLPSYCPKFIAAQSPQNQTEADFWLMILQQRVEVIVVLARWTDSDHSETVRYWPKDRSDRLCFGNIQTSLQLVNNHKYWVERKINLTNVSSKQTHVVTQLQFTAWASPQLPDNVTPLLMFVNEVFAFHRKQQNPEFPVVVHCGTGVHKTGVFLALYNGVVSINLGKGIPDVYKTVSLLRQRRRSMVSEKDGYNYCYTGLLYYAQDVLVKRGILTCRASFGNPLPTPGERKHTRSPSSDFIMSDTSLAALGDVINKPDQLQAPVPATMQDPSPSHPSSTAVLAASPNDARSTMTDQTISSVTTAVQPAPGTANSMVLMQQEQTIPSNASPLEPTTTKAADKSILLTLQDPSKFELGTGRQRISKLDFISQGGGIKKTTENKADPFSNLDPLWSLSKEPSAK